MSRKIVVHFLFLAMGTIIVSCMTMDIGTKADKSIDFKQYKTFAWARRTKQNKHADARIANDIVEGRIIKNSNIELKKRGLTIDTIQPDLVLDYDIITEQKSEEVPSSVYSGDYYYNYSFISPASPVYVWGSNGTGLEPTTEKYTFGTVVIYIGDRAKNHLVWQGWADGTIRDVRSFEEELPKDIRAIFKGFPSK